MRKPLTSCLIILFVVGFLCGMPSAAIAGIIFNDTFTETGDTLLESHVPDIGTSWTIIVSNGPGTGQMKVDAASDTVYGEGPNSVGGAWYTADVTYSTANYEVEGTLNPGGNFGATRTLWLGCRYQNVGGHDGYGAWIEEAAGANDIQLYKFDNGVSMKLSSTEDTNPTDADIFTLVCNGTSISLKKNGSNVINPITDSTHSQIGKAFVGNGDIADITAAASPGSTFAFTQFRVNELTGVTPKGPLLGIYP